MVSFSAYSTPSSSNEITEETFTQQVVAHATLLFEVNKLKGNHEKVIHLMDARAQRAQRTLVEEGRELSRPMLEVLQRTRSIRRVAEAAELIFSDAKSALSYAINLSLQHDISVYVHSRLVQEEIVPPHADEDAQKTLKNMASVKENLKKTLNVYAGVGFDQFDTIFAKFHKLVDQQMALLRTPKV